MRGNGNGKKSRVFHFVLGTVFFVLIILVVLQCFDIFEESLIDFMDMFDSHMR